MEMIAPKEPPSVLIVDDDKTIAGIAPQELPELFHKYHTATQTRAKEGSGLRLFIAKTLTEAHGGQISATSTVGQGTIFTVQLPVQNTPPQLEKQPDARL
jgi:signal transduction histidine kinase